MLQRSGVGRPVWGLFVSLKGNRILASLQEREKERDGEREGEREKERKERE